MAAPDPVLPYGLRDIKLTPLGADGSTPGTAVDLPIAQTLTFSESEEYTRLRGDDAVKATHGSGPIVEWDLEAGGLSLVAYATIAGGAIVTTGVTPNIKKTYTKKVTDARPYFKVEGQAIGDSGGDLHGLVYKCKADKDLKGEMKDGQFWVTSCKGTGFPSTESGKIDNVYDFVVNETAVAIS